ncbi:hypothetical protein [Lelliottia sp.]|uniref:hypothetical protein n=1 Tax=Lelliottia sp. TaxID=1898429 RepID=UPI003890E995
MKLRTALLAAICISSCAFAYAQDTSADLQINGTVKNTESACALLLSSSALAQLIFPFPGGSLVA